MLTFKASISEMEVFAQYIDQCILTDVESVDKAKEFMYKWHLREVSTRILKKLQKVEADNHYRSIRERKKDIKLTLNEPEIMAFSVYFKRFQVHSFIQTIETIIVQNIPSDLLNVY